ncbi:hypothetical protein ATER59S_05330 [Aquamicrobium terrae]
MPAKIFEATANGYAGRVRLFGIDEAIVLVAIEPGDTDNAPAWRIHLDDEDGPEIGGAWNVSANVRATTSRWRSTARFSPRCFVRRCSRPMTRGGPTGSHGSGQSRARIGAD